MSFLSVGLDACIPTDNSASLAVLSGFMPIVRWPVMKCGLLESPETLERIENWPRGETLYCELKKKSSNGERITLIPYLATKEFPDWSCEDVQELHI